MRMIATRSRSRRREPAMRALSLWGGIILPTAVVALALILK
ncbi:MULTISPECIES: hypothetical protein [unclassified Streptomyces]|nr:hypothetical protein [Streptomyces sp. BvitLS-983]SCD49976.1 hypothetical protein GA0115250_11078 [Streptomyces sp. BvitLS-983]